MYDVVKLFPLFIIRISQKKAALVTLYSLLYTFNTKK